MSKEKFTPDELVAKKYVPNRMGGQTAVLSTPITPKENLLNMYAGKTPMWAPFSGSETNTVMLDCDPENTARSRASGSGTGPLGNKNFSLLPGPIRRGSAAVCWTETARIPCSRARSTMTPWWTARWASRSTPTWRTTVCIPWVILRTDSAC